MSTPIFGLDNKEDDDDDDVWECPECKEEVTEEDDVCPSCDAHFVDEGIDLIDEVMDAKPKEHFVPVEQLLEEAMEFFVQEVERQAEMNQELNKIFKKNLEALEGLTRSIDRLDRSLQKKEMGPVSNAPAPADPVEEEPDKEVRRSRASVFTPKDGMGKEALAPRQPTQPSRPLAGMRKRPRPTLEMTKTLEVEYEDHDDDYDEPEEPVKEIDPDPEPIPIPPQPKEEKEEKAPPKQKSSKKASPTPKKKSKAVKLEEMKQVKHVGAKTATSLYAAGIDSLEKLATMKIDKSVSKMFRHETAAKEAREDARKIIRQQ